RVDPCLSPRESWDRLQLIPGTLLSLSFQINTNGFVATTEPLSESTYHGNMPPNFGMIAVLQGDLDTSDGVGKVFFRQDSSPDVLRRAADHINRAFPEDDEVDPTHAVVITWADIATHQPQSRGDGIDKKRNTFQLVIASLKTASYAILLYTRDGIQFSSTPIGDGSFTMHAGFSKGLVRGFLFSSMGPYYHITTNEEASVRDLAEKTNSGLRGVWVYEIGTFPYFTNVAPGEVTDLPTEATLQEALHDQEEATNARRPVYTNGQEVVYPPYVPGEGQINVHPVHLKNASLIIAGGLFHPIASLDIFLLCFSLFSVFSYNLGTCANNRIKCSQFADCRDYFSGYCCHCRPGYYGNGIQCVAEGKPQRMNGKVHGKIYVGNSPSPVEFTGNDLHSYVVVNDGRSYVAISDIPYILGPSLQPLSALGGVIGWAFALEQPGFKNGFSTIGGEFTRQAEVTFLPGNEKLTIRQEFKGIDEHDHLVVSTTLNGQVPELLPGSTVQINPYTELYQYSNNLITSSSTRDYVVSLPDDSTDTRSYQWRQSITFQSCQHDEPSRDVKPTQMLSVDQVFVMFDPENELIRFAMSNKIGDVNGEEDNPCFTGRHGCDTNAACHAGQGNQFTCQCAAGFNGDGRTCYEQAKTQCEIHRDSLLGVTEYGPRGPRPPVGQYIPTCDENGAYEPIQCHGSTGHCWCVDKNGQEIPGTRSGPGSRPMCEQPPVGPVTRPDVHPLPPGTHLLFSQSGRIEHIPLEGYDMNKDSAKAVLHLPEKVIIGVAYDCVDKMVYWTEITSPSISKAKIHGGEPVAVIRSDLQSPEGIAIDHLGRNMFWTDSGKDHIEVASLDGSKRRVIVDSDLVNPRAIIADPPNGNLYWSDWNREAPKIETSYMDGSNRRVLVKDDLGLPNALTYDSQSSLLCWADAGTHTIECMHPGRGDRRKIMDGIQYPFGVTSFGKNIYYTDWRRDAVVAVDRHAGRESDEFQPQKRTKLYGIVTAYAQCPSGQNYCSVNNGGCTHLCLATPGGRSCKCPNNAVGVGCVEIDSGY
uniref:Nidogen 1a n=1 Tax=Mastacembelus armatus TaxID=205130 RepID=A0A7N8X1R9_9TELE